MDDEQGLPTQRAATPALRRVALIVAFLNLAYFGVEFAVATAIGSVSLFADSVDFLEDASVSLLILAALSWTAQNRARMGMALAAILLVPGLATLWTAWEKLNAPVAPDPVPLSLAALGALAVNLTCALMLARYRHHGGSLTKAAFLSARNDTFANVGIIAAAVATAFVWRSAWPDLIVGLAIALLNADAAREVWTAGADGIPGIYLAMWPPSGRGRDAGGAVDTGLPEQHESVRAADAAHNLRIRTATESNRRPTLCASVLRQERSGLPEPWVRQRSGRLRSTAQAGEPGVRP